MVIMIHYLAWSAELKNARKFIELRKNVMRHINANSMGIVLIIIVLIAVALRLPCFTYGLPNYTDADETYNVYEANKLFTGQFDKLKASYPLLYPYINSIAITFTHAFHKGWFLIKEKKVGKTPYWYFLVTARFMNILLSLGVVLITFKCGVIIGGYKTGTLAALFMSFLPFHLEHSISIAPTMLMLFMTSLSIYLCIIALQKNNKKRLFVAALITGMAIGSKYLIFLPLNIALLLWWFYRDGMSKRDLIYRGIICALLLFAGFALTMPILIINPNKFFLDIFSHHNKYGSTQAGFSPSIPLLFYGEYLFIAGITPILSCISMWGGIKLFKKARRELILLVAFPFVWLLFCSTYTIHFTRNIIVVSLPFALLGAYAITVCRMKWVQLLLLIGTFVFLMWHCGTIIVDRCKKDIRYEAEAWIDNNIPAGSRIAREEYTPYCNEDRFHYFYIDICGLAYIEPDSIQKLQVDYVFIGDHTRFHKDSVSRRENIERYRRHLKNNRIVGEFLPGEKYRGQLVRILEIKKKDEREK